MPFRAVKGYSRLPVAVAVSPSWDVVLPHGGAFLDEVAQPNTDP